VKIAIIGAGFYGSYLAYKFSNIKGVKVDLFEKNKKILSETAIKNQYRLHTGYHYPRSIATILQTSEGYKLFKKEFKKFLYFPNKNYYLIHKQSLINFKKYKKTFNNLNFKFKNTNLSEVSNLINFTEMQGCLNTEEGVILLDKLINNFRKKLLKKANIIKNTKITKIDNIKGEIFSEQKKYLDYNFIINSTYQNPNLGLKRKKFNTKFELTAMVKIKNPFIEQCGITIMDGPFCSIYPQNNEYSTISSVKYTPISKNNFYSHIQKSLIHLDKNKVIKNIITHARKYIKLPKNLGKKELIVSYKVKVKNDKGDLRTSNLIMENRQISILCGKLDAVTVIYKIIKKKIGL
jgi:hypothetical protein